MCSGARAVSWATWLLFTGVPARCVALRVRCPGPLGSCSQVCPRGLLCSVCDVLGHLAPVHRSARLVCCVASAVSCATWLLFTGVCCVACALSWATWLLFTAVLALCDVLRLRCPGQLGSCSPVCPLCPVLCLCAVLGHLAPVHRCARSVCCVACAVSWATWLLFIVVPAPCVVSRVPCPGSLGSCSPVCPLSVLCCMYGDLGPLAIVHRCGRSVCYVGCAVSWASWLLFTSVFARCVVLWVACAGRRCGALTCPTGRRLFVAGRGWVRCWARTRPSGRRLFVAGRGWVPSGRTLVHSDGGCSVSGRGWVHCRARTRLSGRRLLLGTCSRAVVCCVLCALSGVAAPGGCCCLAPVRVPWSWPAASLSGVPRGPAWYAAPRPVRSLPVLWLAFPTPWCLSPPQGLAPPALLVAARGTRRPAGNRAHCACRWPPPRQGRSARSASYPSRTPQWGCPWRVPPALVLGCVPCGGWRVWTRLMTRPVSRTVRRATRDSAGAPELFCVDADNSPCGSEDATPGSRACVRALVCPGRVGRAGLLGAFRCASPFPLVALSFCFALGWGCPFLGLFLPSPFFPSSPPPSFFLFFLFFFFRALPLSLAFFGFRPQVPWALALGFLFLPPPRFGVLNFSFFLCAPPLSLAFAGFRPRVPWALALCVVCFVGLPLPGSRCGLPPHLCFPPRCWLLLGGCCLPPASLLCLVVFVAAALCSVFFSFFFPTLALCAPVVSGFRWFAAPGALGRGAVCCLFCWHTASQLAVRLRLLCASRLAVRCSLVVAAPLPLLCLAVSIAVAWFSFFFLFLSSFAVLPHCLWLPLVSCPGCPGPWRCVLFVLLAFRFSALRALSLVLCFLPGRWLLPGGCCPPPPLLRLAVFLAAARCWAISLPITWGCCLVPVAALSVPDPARRSVSGPAPAPVFPLSLVPVPHPAAIPLLTARYPWRWST